MGCTTLEIRNMKRDKSVEISEYDASFLIEHFQQLKKISSEYIFSVEVDQEGQLKHCFWANPTS